VLAWLARRLAQAAVTFALVSALLFFLMRLTPGDPLERLSDDRGMLPQERARLERIFGLDQPPLVQFGRFLGAAVRGDLGVSIEHYPRRVTGLVGRAIVPSLLLGLTVLLVNFTLGVWLGVLQARRRGSRLDRWLTRLALTGYAMPSFWLALMLVTWMSVRWHLFPAAQMHDPLLAPDAPLGARVVDLLAHLALPAITLSVVTIAVTMRYQRTALLEVLRLDFVRVARARGLTEDQVVWRHAWRNALFPVVTLLGLWLPILVSGSVFVEFVFNWPGLGSLAANAVMARDYPVLMATAMLVAAGVLIGGVATDLAYYALDPRTRDR
jgi:peptide/nickel transport system permease protein